MRNSLKILVLLFATCPFFYTSCKDDNGNEDPSGDKPLIENLTVSPATAVSYGDIVTLAGNFSDPKGLQSYTVKLTNAQGDIYETTKMLTGQTFALNDPLVVVLPKNAQAGDVTVSVTLKNDNSASITESTVIPNVKIPIFENLYHLLGTKVCTMEKDENGIFVYEDLIPANATGKIYANPDKSGLYWGNLSDAVTPMVDGDFVIGGAADANLRIAFNPVTFELQIGEGAEQWSEIDEPMYIFGSISNKFGGDIISTERPGETKMQGYRSGNKKYWTWTPPAAGAEEDGWWGQIQTGSFRFKKGGAEQYVLYRNNTISAENADDINASFSTSVGGHVGIKLFYDGTNYNKVSIEEMDWDGNVLKSLDYLLDGALNINGVPASTAITFAGAPLSLKSGTSYVYEGTVDLTKNQDITASGANLATANPDPDVFSGKGNAIWKMLGSTGNWLIRIDPFASTIYACLLDGYPKAIYMDSWGISKFEGDPSIVWNPETRICLQRKSDDSFIYEATFYNNGWGSDANFWHASYKDANVSKKVIPVSYFDGVVSTNALNISILPNAAGYFKVSVDLKDGFTFDPDEQVAEGNYFTLTPVNGKKFTVSFVEVNE
jgi:hypothetical protein